VTRNCQIYIMPLDTLKIGIYKLKDFMICIKLKRNNLFNSIYRSVSPDFRFKETPYVNFFTDPELSSSLYKKSQPHLGIPTVRRNPNSRLCDYASTLRPCTAHEKEDIYQVF